MDSTLPERTPFSTLRMLGQVAPAASALLLSVSVLYDWCYLNALGLSLSNVPTSIADHIRSAVVWLPGLFATLVISNYFSMQWEFPASPRGFSPNKKIDKLDLGLISLGFLLFILAALFLKADFAILFGSMLTLVAIIRFEIGFKRFEDLGWTARTIRLVRTGFCLISLVCLNGASQGYFDANSSKAYLEVGWNNQQENSIQNVTNIRTFGRSSLLVGPNNRIQIVPTDSISKVSFILKKDTSLLCTWIDFSCNAHRFFE